METTAQSMRFIQNLVLYFPPGLLHGLAERDVVWADQLFTSHQSRGQVRRTKPGKTFSAIYVANKV